MKNLLYKIKTMALLALLMAGICSCTDLQPENEEVQVGFEATICADPQTRALGKAEKINTIVVGVFTKGEEDVQSNTSAVPVYVEILRKSFPVTGTTADIQLPLAKGQTYSFIF